MKKRVFAFTILTVFFSIAIVLGSSKNFEDAHTKLIEGNKRFLTGNVLQKDISDAKRKELSKGQNPFAIVLTCSDSRVAPEIIFDQGLGELFVVRTAGNVVDPIALGSIEYAAEHLNVPLLVILGHTQCGAVKASLDAKGKPEGNIGSIIKKILPAVKKAKLKSISKEDILSNAIKENVLLVEKDIVKNSRVIKHLIEKNELKVIKAIYDLSSGKVEVLQ